MHASFLFTIFVRNIFVADKYSARYTLKRM
jgi:hypothetical protein